MLSSPAWRYDVSQHWEFGFDGVTNVPHMGLLRMEHAVISLRR